MSRLIGIALFLTAACVLAGPPTCAIAWAVENRPEHADVRATITQASATAALLRQIWESK